MARSFKYDPDNQQQSKIKAKQLKQQRQAKQKLRELE